MENMTMCIAAATPATRALALLCATPAADLRTSDVRIDVRWGDAVQVARLGGTAIPAQRIRVTAPTTGMGLVGVKHSVFGTGYARGSQTWSPPI